MLISFSEIMGWIGTIAYIIAYLLLSMGKLKPSRIMYHSLNIVGAIGLIINASHYGNYPSVFVNIAWFTIAIIAIFFIVKKWRIHSDEVVE